MIKKTLIALALMPINFVAASQYLLREQHVVISQWQQITPHHRILTTNHYVARQILSIELPSPPLFNTHNECFYNERPLNQIIVPNERPSNPIVVRKEKRTHLTPEIIDDVLGSFVKIKLTPKAIESFLEDLKTRHISLPSFNAWDNALGSIVLNNDYSAIVEHMKNFEYLPVADKDYLSERIFSLLEKQSTSKSTQMNNQQDIKTRFPGLFSPPREGFLKILREPSIEIEEDS